MHIVSGSLLFIRYKTVFAGIHLFEKKEQDEDVKQCQNPASERTFLLLKIQIVSDERNRSFSFRYIENNFEGFFCVFFCLFFKQAIK